MRSTLDRHARSALVLFVVAFVLMASSTLVAPAVRGASPRAPLASAVIYGDALGSGWADWSWDTTVDVNNATPVHGGSQSMAVTFDAAWAGLYLHGDPAVDTSGYDGLRFWIHGGSAGGQQLRVVANGDGSHAFPVTAQPNTWTQVDVPLSALGSPAALSDLYWQDTTGGAQAR